MSKLSQERERAADTCPECSSHNLIRDYDTGETFCGGCGLVIDEEVIDDGAEYRIFSQEDRRKKSRVGLPSFYSVHDKGLSTTMYTNRDAYGRELPPSTRHRMWRLKKWQKRSMGYRLADRNLSRAMTELDRLSDKLYIPTPIKEKAAVIYRKALDKGLVRGRSIDGFAAASLYAACRKTETARTLNEISEESLVERKYIARNYRILLRELDMKMPLDGPLKYISKIAKKVGMSGEAEGRACEILREAKRKHLTAGKDPSGLAGAASYLACLQMGERITQKEIAEAAGITEVTVRNRYEPLKKRLSIEIPD